MTIKKINICIAFSEKIISRGLKYVLTSHPKYQFNITELSRDSQKTINNKEFELLIIDKDPYLSFEQYESLFKGTLKVIWLIDINEDKHCAYILRSNHYAVLTKNIKKSELYKALDMVITGKKYYSSEILKNTGPVHQFLAQSKTLTKRELQVLKYVVTGFSNKEISKSMSIGLKTVESHRYNAMRKINVKNISGVIKYMYDNHLLE